MALILNIETSSKVCSVALAENGTILHLLESNDVNDHSATLTIFIEQILKEAGVLLNEVKAVAVSKGPGSYTGLRIGVSAAKGICYGSDLPFIGICTLQAMVAGLLQQKNVQEIIKKNNPVLVCPMIDARRMEVYTSLYNVNGTLVQEIRAEVLTEHSFSHSLKDHFILFFGNGAEKFQGIISNPNAIFIEGINPSAKYMTGLSFNAYTSQQFEDLAYFEPFYLKDFVTTVPKKII